ncbi:MAG: hypothetical protein IKG18_06135 [Atopobiaceae bacterium]|nr:hypothetical protein [Atopobiaceae bacterium]
MPKKIFEADIPDGMHMPDASDDSGYKRGLLYDDETGRLSGHAKLRELDESELSGYTMSQVASAELADEYKYLREESSLTPQQREALERIGDRIGAIAYAACARFLNNVMNAAEARLEQWWHDSGAEKVRNWRSDAGALLTAFFTGEVHLKAEEILASNERSMEANQGESTKENSGADALSAQISTAYADYMRDITSEEAQRELFEIVLGASILARKINRLSRAHVIDDDTGECFGWAEINSLLTEQSLIDGVNRILSGEVQALSAAQIANLELFLGRDLQVDGAYLPISPAEYTRALGLDAADQWQPQERETEDTDKGDL